jgi:hypothetical protein
MGQEGPGHRIDDGLTAVKMQFHNILAGEARG